MIVKPEIDKIPHEVHPGQPKQPVVLGQLKPPGEQELPQVQLVEQIEVESIQQQAEVDQEPAQEQIVAPVEEPIQEMNLLLTKEPTPPSIVKPEPVSEPVQELVQKTSRGLPEQLPQQLPQQLSMLPSTPLLPLAQAPIQLPPVSRVDCQTQMTPRTLPPLKLPPKVPLQQTRAVSSLSLQVPPPMKRAPNLVVFDIPSKPPPAPPAKIDTATSTAPEPNVYEPILNQAQDLLGEMMNGLGTSSVPPGASAEQTPAAFGYNFPDQPQILPGTEEVKEIVLRNERERLRREEELLALRERARMSQAGKPPLARRQVQDRDVQVQMSARPFLPSETKVLMTPKQQYDPIIVRKDAESPVPEQPGPLGEQTSLGFTETLQTGVQKNKAGEPQIPYSPVQPVTMAPSPVDQRSLPIGSLPQGSMLSAATISSMQLGQQPPHYTGVLPQPGTRNPLALEQSMSKCGQDLPASGEQSYLQEALQKIDEMASSSYKVVEEKPFEHAMLPEDKEPPTVQIHEPSSVTKDNLPALRAEAATPLKDPERSALIPVAASLASAEKNENPTQTIEALPDQIHKQATDGALAINPSQEVVNDQIIKKETKSASYILPVEQQTASQPIRGVSTFPSAAHEEAPSLHGTEYTGSVVVNPNVAAQAPTESEKPSVLTQSVASVGLHTQQPPLRQQPVAVPSQTEQSVPLSLPANSSASALQPPRLMGIASTVIEQTKGEDLPGPMLRPAATVLLPQEQAEIEAMKNNLAQPHYVVVNKPELATLQPTISEGISAGQPMQITAASAPTLALASEPQTNMGEALQQIIAQINDAAQNAGQGQPIIIVQNIQPPSSMAEPVTQENPEGLHQQQLTPEEQVTSYVPIEQSQPAYPAQVANQRQPSLEVVTEQQQEALELTDPALKLVQAQSQPVPLVLQNPALDHNRAAGGGQNELPEEEIPPQISSRPEGEILNPQIRAESGHRIVKEVPVNQAVLPQRVPAPVVEPNTGEQQRLDSHPASTTPQESQTACQPHPAALPEPPQPPQPQIEVIPLAAEPTSNPTPIPQQASSSTNPALLSTASPASLYPQVASSSAGPPLPRQEQELLQPSIIIQASQEVPNEGFKLPLQKVEQPLATPAFVKQMTFQKGESMRSGNGSAKKPSPNVKGPQRGLALEAALAEAANRSPKEVEKRRSFSDMVTEAAQDNLPIPSNQTEASKLQRAVSPQFMNTDSPEINIALKQQRLDLQMDFSTQKGIEPAQLEAMKQAAQQQVVASPPKMPVLEQQQVSPLPAQSVNVVSSISAKQVPVNSPQVSQVAQPSVPTQTAQPVHPEPESQAQSFPQPTAQVQVQPLGTTDANQQAEVQLSPPPADPVDPMAPVSTHPLLSLDLSSLNPVGASHQKKRSEPPEDMKDKTKNIDLSPILKNMPEEEKEMPPLTQDDILRSISPIDPKKEIGEDDIHNLADRWSEEGKSNFIHHDHRSVKKFSPVPEVETPDKIYPPTIIHPELQTGHFEPGVHVSEAEGTQRQHSSPLHLQNPADHFAETANLPELKLITKTASLAVPDVQLPSIQNSMSQGDPGSALKRGVTMKKKADQSIISVRQVATMLLGTHNVEELKKNEDTSVVKRMNTGIVENAMDRETSKKNLRDRLSSKTKGFTRRYNFEQQQF